MTTLTDAECKALYDIIDQLSGNNAENVFSSNHGGEDDPNDPTTMACAKVFAAAGEDVPDGLLVEVNLALTPGRMHVACKECGEEIYARLHVCDPI